jgi:hypothetical protein
MIELVVAGVAAGVGFVKTRSFVIRRLRFVDGVRSAGAPFIAGAIAAAVTAPIALLPGVGLLIPAVIGGAVGAGTRAAARRIESGTID